MNEVRAAANCPRERWKSFSCSLTGSCVPGAWIGAVGSSGQIGGLVWIRTIINHPSKAIVIHAAIMDRMARIQEISSRVREGMLERIVGSMVSK